MSRFRRRPAFTLVELLIVVAIIAVSVALLIAALQKMREAANRSTCADNLRRIAQAALTYDDAYHAVPPNFHEDPSRTDGSHNLFYGPVVRLLPFMGLEDAYRNFSFLYYDSPFPQGTPGVNWPNVTGGMNWRNHTWLRNPFNRPPYQGGPPNAPIPVPDPLACPNPTGSTGVAGQTWYAQGDYPVFSCPSQPFAHFNNGQGTVFTTVLCGLPLIDFPRGNPFANPAAGVIACVETNSLVTGTACNIIATTYSPGSYVLGRSDYVAVLGTFIDGSHTDARFHPPLAKKYHSLFNYGEKASLSRVPDGSSNTLVFSEFCGVYGTGNNSQPQLNGWLSASWTTNAVSVSLGTCPDPKNNNCGFESDPKGSGAALGGWHGGLFQVAFADGSVRALRLGLEQDLLYSLAGYKDGDDVSNSDY